MGFLDDIGDNFNHMVGSLGIKGVGAPPDDSQSTSGPAQAPAQTPLQQLQAQQLQQAQSFRSDLPGLKQQLAEGLTQQSNLGVNQNDRLIDQHNAGRGLLYGGINAGEHQSNRATAQSSLASSVNQGNIGYDQAANNMDAQAISTAAGIQQTQQAAQNQIYSQALAAQNAQNSEIGSAVGTGLLAYMAFSDVRLKKNIKNIKEALPKIESLNGVTWDWKKPEMGVLAQEIEKVFPEAVVEKDGYKHVYYHMLIGPLIESVKELSKEVRDLKLRLGGA